MRSHKHPAPSRWKRAVQWWRDLNLEQKVGVVSLTFIVLTFMAAALVVPEVRCALQLEPPDKCKPIGTQIPPSPTLKPPSDLKNPESNGQPPAKPALRVVPLPNADPLEEPRGPMMTLDESKKGAGASKTTLPPGPVVFGGGGTGHGSTIDLLRGIGKGPVVVSPEEAAKHLILRIEPTYPPAAREAGIQGKVIVRMGITKDGRVESIISKGDNPLLAQAALNSVKQWRYSPFRVDGLPVDVQTSVTLEFSIK